MSMSTSMPMSDPQVTLDDVDTIQVATSDDSLSNAIVSNAKLSSVAPTIDTSITTAVPVVASAVEAVAIMPVTQSSITQSSVTQSSITQSSVKRKYVRCAKGTKREKKRKGKSTRRCMSKKKCGRLSRRDYKTGKCVSKQ